MAIDSALVAPETFAALLIMSAEPREEFVKGAPRGERQPQKINRDGVPVWRVAVAATTWRGRSEMLNVTVAAPGNPMDDISTGSPVTFDGLMFGVSPKQNGGYSVWFSAERVRPAGSSVGLRPVASAVSE